MTILMDPTAAAEITGLADLSLVAPVMTTVRYLGGLGFLSVLWLPGLQVMIYDFNILASVAWHICGLW